MTEPGGDDGDDGRTSPLPVTITPKAWNDPSRWPWYLLVLVTILLIAVSCQLNQVAERATPAVPTKTVTVTARATETVATTVTETPPSEPAGTATAEPTDGPPGTYRRPDRPPDDELVYRTTFTSCTTVLIVYKHGVGTTGAVDQVEPGVERIDDWVEDPSAYWTNEALDTDRDGIACETGDR